MSKLETVAVVIALSFVTWGCYTLYRDTMAILNDGNHNYYCEHCYYGGM